MHSTINLMQQCLHPDHAATGGIEWVTYDQMGERLGVSAIAAKHKAKRLDLPRTRGSDGKTLVAVNFAELKHEPAGSKIDPDPACRGNPSGVIPSLRGDPQPARPSLGDPAEGEDAGAPLRQGYRWARLQPDDIVVIRARLANGEQQASIAADFGVSFQQVSKIKLGKRWGHL
jgi:hypothetical protein